MGSSTNPLMSPVQSPSCADRISSCRGSHTCTLIVRLGSVHLPGECVTDKCEKEPPLPVYDSEVGDRVRLRETDRRKSVSSVKQSPGPIGVVWTPKEPRNRLSCPEVVQVELAYSDSSNLKLSPDSSKDMQVLPRCPCYALYVSQCLC
ncbi:hypothetical protein CRG98_044734 [Punica granatum]|uniref:Uncharacterized protein n=1 Tax=Punica granatum TaxID=22663 RepID=A0A2I0HT41_PUNGR|nr:hypothetical protein CRG98_044734 [Punica granatum]